MPLTTEPGWRNGRRGGLKIRCPQGRVGSSPTPGTRQFQFRSFGFEQQFRIQITDAGADRKLSPQTSELESTTGNCSLREAGLGRLEKRIFTLNDRLQALAKDERLIREELTMRRCVCSSC